MTHTYKITGMTCDNCETKVKNSLAKLPEITSVEVSKDTGKATISMSKHVPLTELQTALGGEKSNYKISASNHVEPIKEEPFKLSTYKPIFLIFAYITGLTLLIQFTNEVFSLTDWMRHFMAGFFLVFSFFKLLNIKEFADTYAMYDIIARKFKPWAYVYAFTELLLGIAFLINILPLLTYSVTFIVMTISIIGVLQTVLNKRRIKCACLGAVFNLPMSTVTIIEDGLMIVMSGVMLLMLI